MSTKSTAQHSHHHLLNAYYFPLEFGMINLRKDLLMLEEGVVAAAAAAVVAGIYRMKT